jgi:hypothetical protein
MIRDLSKGLATGFLVGCVLTAAPLLVSATIVFDDHFDGNSGGMPVGWSLFEGPGTAVESGTTVTLDHDILISSNATLDPSSGTMTITWDIAAASPSIYSLALLLANASLSSAIAIGLEPSVQGFGFGVGARSGGDWENYPGWLLPGYMGGPLRLILVLGPTAFSVACEDPPISSGFVDYTAAFLSFTRADLGPSCFLVLQNDAPSSGTATSSIDRITVDVEGATPVESITFGRLKALYRR